MRVLVVGGDPDLGWRWSRQIERLGGEVDHARDVDDAVAALSGTVYGAVVVDLMLDRQGALAVADMTAFRCPAARVIFVTNSSCFSDGSIFRHAPNAAAFLQSDTPPEDLAAIVHHYARHA